MNDKLQIFIDGQQVDTALDTEVNISYKLEENSNFQEKSSGAALSINLPATAGNSRTSNAYHNPSVEDLTTGEAFKNARNGLIRAGSYEILKGPAYLTEATYTDRPIGYQYDFYGDNSDWMAQLTNTTLFDLLKNITFDFTVSEIMSSWAFDGTNEAKPYVFAPVRYGQQMDDGVANLIEVPAKIIKDYSMAPEYMKPSLSVYWLMVWGFRSIGYRIDSTFMETVYFKRLTMPWTWGNFLYSDGTQTANLTFLAKSTGSVTIAQDFTGIMDLLVSNDATNGGFDDNGVYEYDTPSKTAQWEYLNIFDYGTLEATFHLQINYNYVATDNGTVEARVKWFKNGVQITTGKPFETSNGDRIFSYSAPTVGGNRDANLIDLRQSITVNPNDKITVQFYGHMNDTNFGTAHMTLEIITFEIEYFRVPIGGTIKFTNFLSFKKYLFLDFLRGIIDCFNIIPKANSIDRVITLEPEHEYNLANLPYPKYAGYFNGNTVDWNSKQDISKVSKLQNFRDYNRNLLFKFKDDTSDGILKLLQDRYTVTLAEGKYLLPPRFANDNTTVENRFFAPVMHYNVMQWRNLGRINDAPQMICMVPENISNTSRDEAQNTFSPKLAWYKGEIQNYGWVFNQSKRDTFPYMFAVNYKQGGEYDPVLSYADEKLFTGPTYLADNLGNLILDSANERIIVDPGGYYVAAAGLLRRFYLQRMAVLRNGQYLTTNFVLNNADVANWLHREYVICQGEKWELVEVKNYNPLMEDSTECSLRKMATVTNADHANVFPAKTTVLGEEITDSNDIKYAPLMALSTDIKLSEDAG